MSAGLDRSAEKALSQKLAEKLKQLLPRASETTRQKFLEAVLKPGNASTSLAPRLLAESCTPHEIYLALVYCRNAMMMTFNRLPDQDRAALVKHLLSHHDRYASLLMSAVESRHEQEWQKLQAELLQEGHAHLLSRAQHEWSREKEIYIYNHYKEMPIATVVKLLHVGEHSFTINRNKEIITVFTASEQGDRALTRLPKSELSVELIIEETTRKTVHLQYGEFRPLHKERRREIRVQSARPVDITLKDSAFRTWQGKVCDLSASGLGLTFKCETSFQAGDFLAFSMMLHGHKLIGKGAISWTNNRLGYCRAGMGIEYNQEIRLHLDHEVRQREKKIRAELKLRGIPDAFL